MGSISSPIYFSGMSTYAQDLQNVITQQVQFASLPIQLLQNNENALARQVGELQTLSTKISAVQSAVSNLSNAAGNLLAASVSDPSVAQATLSSGALAGSYTLEVSNLGSASTALSLGGLAPVTDPGSQSISTADSYTLTVDGQTFTITPSANNLNALVQAINDAGAGLQAAVVNVSGTSTPDYRLSLQSDPLGDVSMQLTANPPALLGSGGSGQPYVSAEGLPLVTDPGSQSISTASSFALTVNGQVTTVNPSGNNLNALAQAINDANAGVQATVINQGDELHPDYRLSIDGQGASVQLNAVPQDLLAMSHTGQPVEYAINGQSVQGSSRTVTVAPGLTATLTGTDVGQPATITVAPNTWGVSNALASLVTAYNSAIDELNANRGQAGGALAGQSIIYQLTSTLGSLASYSSGNDSISSLACLGLTFNDTTGHLSFDAGTFASATDGQSAALSAFLGSATDGGFLQLATNALSGIEDPTDGYLPQQINSLTSQIQSITQQMSDKQNQVNLLQQNLTQQMAAADALIAQMQQQATYFNSMWTAIQAAETGKVNG
jgi:flagellar hook-associated protein 2